MSAVRPLDLVGIGSMVFDRLHRAPRIVGPDRKGVLRSIEAAAFRAFAGGVVLNQLGWAATMGLRTGIFGRQADDDAGRFLRATMERAGIETHLDLDGSASSMAEIFVDDTGERAIYFAPGATAETSARHVRERHAEFLRRATRLTTEVHQLPLDAVLEALRLAREAGLSTVVDVDVPPSDAVPALGDEATLHQVLRSADLLKPSRHAAQELVGMHAAAALDLARRLRAELGVSAVVVTDGEAGCAVATQGFEGSVPAYPVKAVDATGAGDAFLGGLVAGIQLGVAWPDAARLGSACGAACVEQLGAFPEDRERARARVLELYDGTPIELAPLRTTSSAAPSGACEALATFDVALEELAALRGRLGPKPFESAARLVREAEAAGGRVHVTGVGKPEHVARYAAGLLASTGTPSTFLHATEAVHGSAGQVVSGDVVIAVSNSGETAELCAAVDVVVRLGARVIAVTGGLDSRLARAAHLVLDAGVSREGGGLGLAPRSSVAAEVLVLAALAAELEHGRGFTRDDYHVRHPAGRLGEKSRGT